MRYRFCFFKVERNSFLFDSFYLPRYYHFFQFSKTFISYGDRWMSIMEHISLLLIVTCLSFLDHYQNHQGGIINIADQFDRPDMEHAVFCSPLIMDLIFER